MCQPKCRHSTVCAFNGTGYECDLNNDRIEDMCHSCSLLAMEDARGDAEHFLYDETDK